MLKLKKCFIPCWVFLVFFAGLWLSGCGGGGGGDASSGSADELLPTDGATASFYGGTVVDPYIEGAVLAEVSPEGATLQYSTPSDEKGKFYFSSPLTSGSIIQIDGAATGKHLMRPFEGMLKRVVDQEGPLVVSPLTTLLANGMSAGEVLTLLAEGGLNGLTAEDLLKDPLAELIQCDWPLSAADLTLLQANVGVNAFFARSGNYELDAENILAQRVRFLESVELARSITLELNTLNNLERELWREADSVGLPLRTEPILWAGVSIAEASVAAERQGEDLLLIAGEKMGYARDLALLYFVQQNRGEPRLETSIADGQLPQIAANSVVVVPEDIQDEVSWTEDNGDSNIVAPAPADPTFPVEPVEPAPPVDPIEPPTTPADLGPLKVFPGAQGFGTSSIAGRGGQIIKVTNLNDSGAGSLRAAVAATGPRVIVFEVSGRINLLSNLSVKNPYITIAGQTAPAPGVMITGRTFIVTTHDVLVQHLSIRVGDEDKSDDSGRTADTIQITGTGAYNIVFDHVSASWAIDEIVGIGYGIKDITFSNCIIAEGLNNSVHPKGAHGYGFLLGDDSTRISLIGNLLAHAADRMPRVQGGDFLLVNNVIYNKGGGNFIAIGSNAGIATRMSAVGNLFLEGPDGVKGKAIAENSTTTAAGSAIYQKDNAYPGGTIFGGSHGVSTAPAASWISGLTYMTDPVNQVKTSVLKNAGARPAFRDAADKRVVTNTMDQTGRIIDSQRDVGGFPVLAQNKATFSAGTNPGGDDNRNGYTNLEEILYQMARQVEGR